MVRGSAVVFIFTGVSYFIPSLPQDSFIQYPIGRYWKVFFPPVFYYSKSCCYDNSYTCPLVHMSKGFSKIYDKCKMLSLFHHLRPNYFLSRSIGLHSR